MAKKTPNDPPKGPNDPDDMKNLPPDGDGSGDDQRPDDDEEDGDEEDDDLEDGPVNFPEAVRDMATDPKTLRTAKEIATLFADAMKSGRANDADLAKERLKKGDRYYLTSLWLRFALSIGAMGSVVWLFAVGKLATESAVILLGGIVGSLFVTPRRNSDEK